MKKKLYMVTALLIALLVTGGVFAYGATTAAISATVTDKGDFVSISANTTPTWDVYASYKGSIGAKNDVLLITPGTDFTSDMIVEVYLTNGEELTDAYSVLNLNLKVEDSDNTSMGTGVLTLENAMVKIDVASGYASGTLTVDITSGYYVSNSDWTAGSEDVDLLAMVRQKGS